MEVDEGEVKVEVVKFEDNDSDSDEFEGEDDDDDNSGGGGMVRPVFDIRLCSASRWREEEPIDEEVEVPMVLAKKKKPKIKKTQQAVIVQKDMVVPKDIVKKKNPKLKKTQKVVIVPKQDRFGTPICKTLPPKKRKSRAKPYGRSWKIQMAERGRKCALFRKRKRLVVAGEDPPPIEEMWQNYDKFMKTKVKLSYETRVNMNQLHCLMCYKLVEGQGEVQSTEKLQENLNTIFILRKVLEVPNEQLQTYMKHCNGPSNWIGFCEACQPLIKDALEVNDKIVGLMKQLEKCKELVVDKIRENVRRKEEESSSSENCLTCGETGCKQEHKSYLTYKIRKHVTKNTYVPAATILEGGDTEAKTKLEANVQAKQARKCQHVLLVRPPPPPREERCLTPPREERCLTPTSPEHSPAQEFDISEVLYPSTSGSCNFDFRKISKEIPVQTSTYAQSSTPLTMLVPIKQGTTSTASTKVKQVHLVKQLKPQKKNVGVPNRYLCPTCPQLPSMSLSAFLHHIAFHQQRPNKCAECLAYLPSDSVAINTHWNELHKDSSTFPRTIPVPLDVGHIWECQTCEQFFSSEEELDDHEVEVHDTFPNKTLGCSNCPKHFCSILDWQFHRVMTHPKVAEFSCFYCDVTFSVMTKEGIEILDKLERIKHLKAQHSDLPSMPHYNVCRFCGQCFLSRSPGGTSTHISTHLQDVHRVEEKDLFPCSICHAAFKNQTYMQGHVKKLHLTDPVQICDVCGWNSKRSRSVLHQHRFKEHGITPPDEFPLLKCDFEGCSFRTVLREQLKSHKRRHLPVAERPYKCEQCSKRFCDSNQLSEHLSIHKNALTKPFQCELCGSSFAVKNYLYIHMRLTHEGRYFPSTHKKKPSRRAAKPSTVPSSNDMAKVELNTLHNQFEENDTERGKEVALLNNSASESVIG
ncbi:putative zinc finger protein [Orchesella cincta]|uniref:Putative zinc finger protein n=1 Tax=Orchesella cincta TaxID=48709 RepID=A0A1D2MD79_ORCCI|nr:putative zinc finger protein [Orchesella cincta]